MKTGITMTQEGIPQRPIISPKTFATISFIKSVIAFVLVFAVYISFWGIAVVPTSSMLPTLQIRSKFLYHCVTADELGYDDIVLFFPHGSYDKPIANGIEALYHMKIEGEKAYVKRVIGLPGDVLVMKDGYVYRNGEKLDPDYIAEPMITDGKTYVVPKDHIFCMGDNRNDSLDSRYIGAIPVNNFFGKLVVHFP